MMPAVMVAQVLGSQGDRNNGGQGSAVTAAGDNGVSGDQEVDHVAVRLDESLKLEPSHRLSQSLAASSRVASPTCGSNGYRPRESSQPPLQAYLQRLENVQAPDTVSKIDELKDTAPVLPVKGRYPTRFRRYKDYDATKTPGKFIRSTVAKRGEGLIYLGARIMPKVLVQVALNLIVLYLNTKDPGREWYKLQSDVQKYHTLMGGILAYLLVFRSGGAYDRYYEGRKTLGTLMNQARELMLEVYTTFVKEDTAEHAHQREEVRRLTNIMLVFIRQHVRESQVGLCPNSPQKDLDFHDKLNFTQDPSRPRLYELLTPEEVELFSNIRPASRAVCVACKIRALGQIMTRNIEFTFTFLSKINGLCQGMLDSQETLYRISTTPVPYPYTIILRIMTAIFVFMTPFIYNSGTIGNFVGSVVLAFSYYGCMLIAEQLENPFEWDMFDIDMEVFNIWFNDEARDIATFTHGQEQDYIPSQLRK